MTYRDFRMGCGGFFSNAAAFQRNFVLQVLLVLALGGLVENVEGYHTFSYCVQFGQSFSGKNDDNYKANRRLGPYTIGTRKFDLRYNFLDYLWKAENKEMFNESDLNNSQCPSYPIKDDRKGPNQMRFDPCVSDDVIELRTYAVKQNGKIMRGWLNFEFEPTDKTGDAIMAIYFQVRDEDYNSIGEFISDPQEQCAPSKPFFAHPTKYQIYPCSAVGHREAKTSNAVLMANWWIYRNNQSLKDTKYLPKLNISRGVHFTWRLSEYWCNRHLRFRPEAIIFTQRHVDKAEKVKDPPSLETPPLIYRKIAKYWIRSRWFGAADIKLPKTTLSCNEKVINYKTGKVDTKLAPWLHEKGILAVLGNDYLAIKQHYNDTSCGYRTLLFKGCQVNPLQMYSSTSHIHPYAKKNYSTFGGRCVHHSQKTTSHDALQGCNMDEHNNAPEFDDVRDLNFPNYTHIVNELTINRTKLCEMSGNPCRLPSPADLSDIQKFNDTSGEYSYVHIINYYGAGTRNATKVEKLLIGRKYHASLCILWTMFLTPLGIFCARYFKETCMSVTCTGAHFWFWVHLATTVIASSVFISSLTGIWANMGNWGRNIDPAGIGHRIVGYFSVTLFFLMLILGGVRPVNKKIRVIIITSHSIIGFLIYYLNFFAMFLSFFIPASPTIGQCDEMGFSTEMSSAIIPMMIWFFLDTTLHVAMTVMQFMKDRSIGVQRPWYCPIIPILPHDSADDFAGSSIRKIMLLVYTGSAFILSITTIGMILGDDAPPMVCRERTGQLSCKELWGCSASSLAYALKVNTTAGNSSGSYMSGYAV